MNNLLKSINFLEIGEDILWQFEFYIERKFVKERKKLRHKMDIICWVKNYLNFSFREHENDFISVELFKF